MWRASRADGAVGIERPDARQRSRAEPESRGRTILWLAGVNASVKMENSNYVQLFTIFAPPITQFRTRQVHSPPICSSFATYLFATARDKKNELQNHVCIFFDTPHCQCSDHIKKREKKLVLSTPSILNYSHSNFFRESNYFYVWSKLKK